MGSAEGPRADQAASILQLAVRSSKGTVGYQSLPDYLNTRKFLQVESLTLANGTARRGPMEIS